jgi:hypothetical protein
LIELRSSRSAANLLLGFGIAASAFEAILSECETKGTGSHAVPCGQGFGCS